MRLSTPNPLPAATPRKGPRSPHRDHPAGIGYMTVLEQMLMMGL